MSEPLRAVARVRAARVREDDDVPRFAGLPLEEFEQGAYVPQVFACTVHAGGAA